MRTPPDELARADGLQGLRVLKEQGPADERRGGDCETQVEVAGFAHPEHGGLAAEEVRDGPASHGCDGGNQPAADDVHSATQRHLCHLCESAAKREIDIYYRLANKHILTPISHIFKQEAR